MSKCPKCEGTGFIAGLTKGMPMKCIRCSGTGKDQWHKEKRYMSWEEFKNEKKKNS